MIEKYKELLKQNPTKKVKCEFLDGLNIGELKKIFLYLVVGEEIKQLKLSEGLVDTNEYDYNYGKNYEILFKIKEDYIEKNFKNKEELICAILDETSINALEYILISTNIQ